MPVAGATVVLWSLGSITVKLIHTQLNTPWSHVNGTGAGLRQTACYVCITAANPCSRAAAAAAAEMSSGTPALTIAKPSRPQQPEAA